MAEFENKLSYECLVVENLMLKNKCEQLSKRNEVLEENITSIRYNMGYEICKFYNQCRSLKETAEQFCYDDIVDCGNALVYFNGCSDSIQNAKDYKEYRILAYGPDDDDSEDEEKTEILSV
jgi:hypothetical protein